MGEWNIFGTDGQVKATVKRLEYNGEFMGERSLTASVTSPTPIAFEVGDYITYRNENFVVDYELAVTKQARSNTYGEGFVYDNIKFLSRQMELTYCKFLDYVISDNLVHYSSLPTFSFYCESITDLTDRIQANLDRLYTGDDAWTITVHTENVTISRINIDVSGATCWDALALVNSKFGTTFIVRGRSIEVAPSTDVLTGLFQYGKGNGLRSITKSSDPSQGIITRIRAMGNTTNMPLNYYRNKNMYVYAPITEIMGPYETGADIHVPLDVNGCFTVRVNENNPQYRVMVSLDKENWTPAIFSQNQPSIGFSVVTIGMYEGYDATTLQNILNKLANERCRKVYFLTGISKDKWPSEYKEYSGSAVVTTGEQRLMLPGYPDTTTDPYIDSTNITHYGVREESVMFDGSGSLEDIYPTIQGMTAELARAAGATISLDYGDNGHLDEVAAATQITDDGLTIEDQEGDEVPTFNISLKDLGFDIKDYASVGEAVISMRDGKCEGREFTIVDVTHTGNKYVLQCERQLDDALNRYFPYNNYNIVAGDKFVLLNIEMPDLYIDVASQRLYDAAEAYLAKIDHTLYTIEPKIDNIKAQRHDDEVESSGEGVKIYDTIYEGMLMQIDDDDLGIEDAIFIDHLTIKEGDSLIPQYDVVLRNEKSVGTVQQIQNQIADINMYGATGNINANGIGQMVKNYGDARYLRKDADDTASGDITFKKSIHSDNFISGFSGGSGWAIQMKNFLNAAGINEKKSYAEFDNLTIRGALRVFEFIVSQMLGENDNRIFTAMMEVDHYDTESGKVFLDTQDGKLYNPFRVDDVIVVQQYDPANTGGGGGTGYIIKAYELVITEVGVGSTSDGENRLDWVKFKNFRTEIDGANAESLIAKNDTFVRMDNLSDPTRRGIAQMMTVGENAPYLDIIYGAKTQPDTKLKARLGNLQGIYNHLFGWLSEYGLYSLNAYLTGQFRLATTGSDTYSSFQITNTSLSSVYRQTLYNTPKGENYLSNPSFLNDLEDWVGGRQSQTVITTYGEDLVMFNRNIYSDVERFCGLGTKNGKQMLRIKNSSIKQLNEDIRNATTHREYDGTAADPDTTGKYVYDVMYITIKFYCVSSGVLKVGFIDPEYEGEGVQWIDTGYEPDGTEFENPIVHVEQNVEIDAQDYERLLEVGTIETSGKWDGTGDFYIEVVGGEIYFDTVAFTTEPLDNFEATYETRIVQDAYHISLLAQRITENETDISDLTITADGITARVETVENGLVTQGSLLTQTNSLISAQVGAVNPETGVFEYSANFALAVEDGVSSATISADQVKIDAEEEFSVNDVLVVYNDEVNINGRLNGCDGVFSGGIDVSDHWGYGIVSMTTESDPGHGTGSFSMSYNMYADATASSYTEIQKLEFTPGSIVIEQNLGTIGTMTIDAVNGITFVRDGTTYNWP